MAAAAGLSLVAQTNIGSAFFAIYVLFFCLLICCFEVGLNVSHPPIFEPLIVALEFYIDFLKVLFNPFAKNLCYFLISEDC